MKESFRRNPNTYLERISLVSEKMLKVLGKSYLNDRQIMIIIDGLDDVLRYKKNKMDIISSMIRSADFINDYMTKNDKR